MCNLSELIEERGIQQGIQQGSKEKCQDIVRNMLRFGGMSDEDILKMTEISREELEQMRKDL